MAHDPHLRRPAHELPLEERVSALEAILKTDSPLIRMEAELIKQVRISLPNTSELDLTPSLQDTFPDINTSRALKNLCKFNTVIDSIWDVHRQQKPCLDPWLRLPHELMHEIFLHVVDLQSIAESRSLEGEIIPRKHPDSPLVLASVSRTWNTFVTSSPQLWSHILIDTEEAESAECLRVFLCLAGSAPLFVVLQGSTVVSDVMMTMLLEVSGRINAFIYPTHVSSFNLAKFMLDPPKGVGQSEPTCRWRKLEAQLAGQPQQRATYRSFPTSMQGLWMDDLFLLSSLAKLSHFSLLSFLSVKIRDDLDSKPRPILELPNLEKLRIQMAYTWNQRVIMPAFMICRRLKVLHFQCTLELNSDSSQQCAIFWPESDVLQELQIHLTVHSTAVFTSNSRRMGSFRKADLDPLWITLPYKQENIRQSSLEVAVSGNDRTLSYLRDEIEKELLSQLPRVMQLTTSKILHPFPKYLQRLRINGFSTLYPSSFIYLPSLVSLEVNTGGFLNLDIMRYIRAPRLRVLRVQVRDGQGGQDTHNWGGITRHLLDHVSLRIGMHSHKQGNHVLMFLLPPTYFLHIFSPYIPLRIYLSKPAPLSCILNASLNAMDGALHGQIDTLATMTEWINPTGIPHLATFRTMVSLRRIVLDRRLYILSEQSPTDDLFKLLAENIDSCPQLTLVTLAQCPSSWQSFLYHLFRRNLGAMSSRSTKCIEELSFYQPLHTVIIRSLTDAINVKILNVMVQPPFRKGKAWPMRPIYSREDESGFRSCYVCHITGMEPGCLEHETRNVDCGRERSDGPKIQVH
jgi:hypothetical protein